MIHWLRQKGILYFVRLSLMIVLTSFNFWLAVIRWGWSDVDPVIKTSALIVAGATEIGLFAFLVLFHLGFYTPTRRGRGLVGWALASLACVGVSLYVNIGYFSLNWHDQAGNTLADLLIRALFPMGLLLFFAMIPPKVQRFRTVSEVEHEYAGKLTEAKKRLELAELAESAKDRRRNERAKEEAKRVRLLRLAGPDLVAEYTVTDADGFSQIDYLGLEMAVEDRQRLAALPTVEEMIHAVRSEETIPATLSKPFTVKDYYTAAEIAETTGWPVRTVRNRMSDTYKGHHPIRVARKQGPRGERLVTHNEMQRLLTMSGISDPELPAIARQENAAPDGNVSVAAAAN